MNTVKKALGVGFLAAAATLAGCVEEKTAFTCTSADGNVAKVLTVGTMQAALTINKKVGVSSASTEIYRDANASELSNIPDYNDRVSDLKMQAQNYCTTGVTPTPK